MCVVCTDWLKGKMTSDEALRALGEMIDVNSAEKKENGHYYEVAEQILEKETSDGSLVDKLWPKK